MLVYWEGLLLVSNFPTYTIFTKKKLKWLKHCLGGGTIQNIEIY